MDQNKKLNDLLKWSIENTDTSNTNGATPSAGATSDLTPEILAAITGGPSDADLMNASIEIITDPEVSLENKLISFDNFEQLIENLDNANNMANLGLWTPLLEQLQNAEGEIRKMTAWCVGTAVQNNVKTQEKLLAMGGLGIPALVELATKKGEPEDVKRKAIYALSSACRNYQPALDVCAEELTKRGVPTEKVDATEMENVDNIMNGLREKAKAA